MTELLFFDPNSGNPMLTSTKKFPKNAKAEDYLNILVLFVNYKNAAGVVKKVQLKSDYSSIVKELYRSYPFNAFRDRVNIFTPKIQPDLGVVYSPTSEMGGFAFKKSIENKVKLYNYQSFIKGGDVWLWSPNFASKRSHGCVAIVSGDTSQKRSSFKRYRNPARRPKNWARNLGAIKQSIGYFFIASKKHGESRKDRLPERFIHELGHGLNLADEYEKEINNTNNDGVWEKYRGPERPNVISRNALWKTTGPFDLSEIIKEGIFPTAHNIDHTKIPWAIMLGNFSGVSPQQKSKLLNLNKHDSRNISEARCTGFDENGDALINDGPFTYDRIHRWCQKRTPKDVGSTSKKNASTGLDIGLYEGGDTKSFDIFRPQKNCRMRDSGVRNESYCWVCQKWILYRVSAPVFKLKISSFKKWIKKDLLLQLAIEIRSSSP